MVGIMAEDEYSSYNNHIGQTTADDGYDSEEEFIDDTQFEDPEDFVDSIEEADLVGDVLDQKPKESDSTDTVIIVDNIPVVGPDRLDKLKNIIRKVFSKFGNVVNEYYPEADGKTKGFTFLEFSHASDAANAIKTANGYKLDKSHTFLVNSFADFEKYKNVSDDWVAPEARVFNDVGNLWSWTLEPDSNDQYCVIHAGGEKVHILQNNATAPSLIQRRDMWTDTYVMWSPQGTYLATFHRQGIALWGGEEFGRLHRFNHANVQLIDFSPNEKYVVTYSPVQDNTSQDPSAICIWDMKSGLKKRGFVAGGGQWPVFKWSPDGAYVARSTGDALSVYEAPNFGLLDKKTIKISELKDFSWSPSQNLIAYWVPEDKDSPARVCILEIPSRREIRVKNLFNVSDCKMHWQKNGDYLCVKVERYTKSKKGVYYNLELFRMKEKNIPIDTLEIKDPVDAFEWEPNGSKFCVIHGENPRITASFYQLEERTLGKVTLLKSLEKKTCNTISWAPNGQFCVLAGLRSMNGVLEFIDTEDMTTMNTGEHYMATDVEWDPTGRYVMTGVSWWAHKVDNGYFIWSFQGKILQRHALDQFCHFAWRPRPVSLLTEKDIKRIKKELKRYQKAFEMKDRMSQTKASKEMIDKRRALFNEFNQFREKHLRMFQENKEYRLELREGNDTDSLESEYDEIDEETVEFFVREEIEIIDSGIETETD
jgi:translation initiation factor 3 subunit B